MLYTRSNRLSNRFDNRLYRIYKHSTGCQTGLSNPFDNRFDNWLYRVYSQLSNLLYNPVWQLAALCKQTSNRLDVCLHDRLYRVNGVSRLSSMRLVNSRWATVSILCPKNVTTLSHYNSDTHESILIIFGTNVTEKVGNQKIFFIFRPHLTSVFLLPGETGNQEIVYFHLNAACFLGDCL